MHATGLSPLERLSSINDGFGGKAWKKKTKAG